MTALVWGGAALLAAGLALLMNMARRAAKVRRGALSDAEIQAELRVLIALNFGGVGLAVIGFALIAAGVLLR